MKATRDALEGTWKTGQSWWGVKEGAIDIVSISDKVPADLKAKLDTVKAGLKDGSYKISGTKIFISAGEHDLAKNIVHLVLARIEGAPEGVKGISLFVTPKLKINADGSVGGPNGVSCGVCPNIRSVLSPETRKWIGRMTSHSAA